MKCLVLSLPENSKKVTSIISCIKKYDADCLMYDLSTDCINENIDNFNTVRLQSILTQLKDTTHCIIVDFENFQFSSTLTFILGVLSGKQIPIFISGKDIPLYKILFGDTLIKLGETGELTEEVQKYFATYLSNEKIQNALHNIECKGIEFCTDSFVDVIAHGDFETGQFFLEAGMDINSKNLKGLAALSRAVRVKNSEAVEWLIDNGADVNCIAEDRGYTPVMDAVLKSDLLLTKLLVNHGATLNTIGKDGQSILGLAVGAENEAVSIFLFENGADPDLKDGMNMSARDYAKLFNKKRLIDLFGSRK
ncbi:MAG: hypothetical protein BKP49_01345 [Treponema sp. CETP13]|nr:MAG: hypothetical protein BKP49_01345 [Treponema sp. CETP13]